MILLYYVLSLAGSAAHVLYWFEWSAPLLNIGWLIALAVAGVAAEVSRSRGDFSPLEEGVRAFHAVSCSVLTVYAVTWPGLLLAATGDSPPRPLSSPVV